MRTQEIKLFSIEELSEEAKEKAVQYLRDRDYFGIESDHLTDQFKERLEEYGLPTNVEWSLGHSQGDGVAFYGDIDVEKLLRNIGEWSEYSSLVHRYELSATSSRNAFGHHYSHAYTMAVFMERSHDYRTTEDLKLAQELWALIELRVRSVSRELEKMGYDEIEYRQKDENIIECAEANEMEFREDGRLWAE